MKVTIIDYGAGNIKSIQCAFKRLGVEAVLSNEVEAIISSDKIIFPGVGEASTAMAKLKTAGLDELIPTLKQPVLGICLGMQLMCISTEENNTKGMGIFSTKIKRFSNNVKVPQIGWNRIDDLQSNLFKGVETSSFMYSVHSYYAESCREEIARTTYGLTYASALQKDNFYGVQFHPEKSSETGERVLKNFLSLT